MSSVKRCFGPLPLNPFNPFDLKFPPTRNPKDPDQHFFDRLEVLKEGAKTASLLGNTLGYGAAHAAANMLMGEWVALQLNPWTAHFFDGVVTPPHKP